MIRRISAGLAQDLIKNFCGWSIRPSGRSATYQPALRFERLHLAGDLLPLQLDGELRAGTHRPGALLELGSHPRRVFHGEHCHDRCRLGLRCQACPGRIRCRPWPSGSWTVLMRTCSRTAATCSPVRHRRSRREPWPLRLRALLERYVGACVDRICLGERDCGRGCTRAAATRYALYHKSRFHRLHSF